MRNAFLVKIFELLYSFLVWSTTVVAVGYSYIIVGNSVEKIWILRLFFVSLRYINEMQKL